MNNLVTRSIAGVGFVAAVVACLLLDKFLFAGFMILIMAVMLHEFFKMSMGPTRYKFSRILAVLAGVTLFTLIFICTAFGMSQKYVALALIPMLTVMANSLLVKDKSEFGKFAYIYTGLMYIAVPLSLSNLIVFKDGVFNGLLMLCFFIIIWASDTGAYIFGMALGQRPGSKKLCPSISPKKSWAGFWGGMVTSVAACIVMNLIGMMSIPWYHGIILAILMHIGGVFGDLFESQWKRYYDIKDSGNFIPGHGGALDRFDSTLFAIPFGAIYLSVFNLL